jgi:hypothetical protein
MTLAFQINNIDLVGIIINHKILRLLIYTKSIIKVGISLDLGFGVVIFPAVQAETFQIRCRRLTRLSRQMTRCC